MQAAVRGAALPLSSSQFLLSPSHPLGTVYSSHMHTALHVHPIYARQEGHVIALISTDCHPLAQEQRQAEQPSSPTGQGSEAPMAAVRQKVSQAYPSAGGSQPDIGAAAHQHAHFNRALQRPLPAGQPSAAPASAQPALGPNGGQPQVRSGLVPRPQQSSSSAAAQPARVPASTHPLAAPSAPEMRQQLPPAAEAEPSSARKRTKQDIAAHRQGMTASQDAAEGRGDKRQKAAAGQDTSALGSAATPIAVTDSDEEDRPLYTFTNFNAFQRPAGHAVPGRAGGLPAGSQGPPAGPPPAAQAPAPSALAGVL